MKLLNILTKTNPNHPFQVIFFAVGAVIAGSLALKTLKNLFLFLQPSKDLAKRYGKASWAIITGASRGVGKAFAFELADRGFNVVLISRNQESLTYVSRAIQYKYPDIQTKIISTDLISAYQEGFVQNIFEHQLKDLDISILVNNAGDYISESYIQIPTNKIRDLILLDTVTPALMISAFLNLNCERNQRKAIINISSIGASFPRPKMQPHSASKAFLDYLSQGLAYEYQNVDILSVKPLYIKTSLTEGTEPEIGAITPEEFVQATFKSLGKTYHTYGHWKHITRGSISNSMYNLLGSTYIKYLLF